MRFGNARLVCSSWSHHPVRRLAKMSAALVVGCGALTFLLPPPAGAAPHPVTVPVGNSPFAVAVDPTTHLAYVANTGDNTVSEIKGTSVVATVSVGEAPVGVAVDPTSHLVYVANNEDGTVTEISGSSVVATVPVGLYPQGVAVDPTTHLAYVANTGDNTVTEISGSSVVATVPVGNGPMAVAVDPTTHLAYVANEGDNTVTEIDGTTVTATVPVGNDPWGVAVDPTTHLAYVVNEGDDSVSEISGTTVTATVPVGYYPQGIAVDPTTHYAYVTNSEGQTMNVINGTTVVATVPVGSFPLGVAVDPTTHLAYVVNEGDDSVSRIPVAQPTTTVIESAQNPMSYGQTVNVTVTPGANGVATITNGGIFMGYVAVHDGSGTIPAQILPPSSYSLQASFTPSEPLRWTESSSSATQLTVVQAPTSVNVTTSDGTGPGSPVQLIATIASAGPAGLAPTGGVEFEFAPGTPDVRCNDEHVRAGPTTGSRAATCTLGPSPVPGNYAGTATYLGDSNHLESTPAAFSFMIST